MEFIKHSTNDNFTIYTQGEPDYDRLPEPDKRALLLPLLDAIREYYKDPENLRQYEIRKANREKQKAMS